MRLLMPEVYSLYFPETAAAARELREDPAFDAWFDEAWLGREAAVPGAFLDAWRRWSGLDLASFPHAVVGNGSSELIRELVSGPALLVFEAEYEGYAAIAAARGMSVCRIPRPAAPSDESVDATLAALPSGTRFCVSEPSARDGEHWPHLGAFLARLQRLNPGVRVALDATYVGLVRSPTAFPVDHPNVDTVLFSLSKPFGLYRYRVGGAFTRLTWPAFAYNHWFNNLFGLKLGLKLMGRHARGELPGRYAEHQAALVAHLVSRGLLPADAEPSNVLLLARSRQAHAEPRYNRAPGLSRYCLTPGLHHLVHGGSLS